MDLSKHTSLAGLAETIKSVERAALQLESPVYLTGAMARDLWLTFGHGIEVIRATEDVDQIHRATGYCRVRLTDRYGFVMGFV